MKVGGIYVFQKESFFTPKLILIDYTMVS